MMPWKEALTAANEALKTYHTIEASLHNVEESAKNIKTEIVALRCEIIQLESRVARPEENRNTISAEVRAIVAEGKADFEVARANTVADLRVEIARAESQYLRRIAHDGGGSVRSD